jgi:uncharacterized damage-inducible protein DinB
MGDSILRELLRGKGAHVDPVACVEDVSADLAARVLAGYPHSIWQIVAHMNYWMEYDLGAIAGHGRPYPEKAIESWPENPGPVDNDPSDSESESKSRSKDEQWQSVTRRLADLLARMELLAESDTEALARKVKRLGPGQSSIESTVHAMLWQIAAHNSYHLGQIALLRRVFGAWPPRRGGDTWGDSQQAKGSLR